jgi:hypothetical protein
MLGLRSWFTGLFSEAIKPIAAQLSGLAARVRALEDRPVGSSDGFDATVETVALDGISITKRKPLITKTDALKNLEEYESGYKSHRKQQPSNNNVGSEVEFYEKNNKELKRSPLMGAAAIDAFIARAKKDEVRLVRQVR